MESITANITNIRTQIAAAAQAVGRDPGEIELIGISKTHPVDRITAAHTAGIADFGESRVQEAEEKIAALATLRSDLRWHLIGHLQTNKARKAASLFDYVHSVDSTRLATALDRGRSELALAPLAILLQVNVSGEESKEGFQLAGWESDPSVLEGFCADVAQILALPHLYLRGLMTIAPLDAEPAPTFRSTRRLREALRERFPNAELAQLSMGMSNDFAAAIAEGATMVRVGTAIFGAR